MIKQKITIPKGWEVLTLGNLSMIKKGEQLNRLDLIEFGEYPALNGGISPSGYTDNWNMEANTITISEGGNSCGYVNFNKRRFWCGGHCYAIRNIKEGSSIPESNATLLARSAKNAMLDSYEKLQKIKRRGARGNQRTKWGSCSKKGNLNFNYKIALMPEKIADYIVVHELCHLKEFNHSRKFWNLVVKIIPDYLEIKKELKNKSLIF